MSFLHIFRDDIRKWTVSIAPADATIYWSWSGAFPTFLPLILHFRQLPPTSTGAISISCCPIASIRIFRTSPTPYAYYTSIEMSRKNIDDCNLIDKI